MAMASSSPPLAAPTGQPKLTHENSNILLHHHNNKFLARFKNIRRRSENDNDISSDEDSPPPTMAHHQHLISPHHMRSEGRGHRSRLHRSHILHSSGTLLRKEGNSKTGMAGNISAGKMSTGNISSGNMSTGNMSMGMSMGNVSMGNVSMGAASDDEDGENRIVPKGTEMNAVGNFYHLRWADHSAEVLSAFEGLLGTESFVDVSLMVDPSEDEGEEMKIIKAHKVVLSACSDFFRKILEENPCKHPVIVLKDFKDWEIEALLTFMYRGIVEVSRDKLHTIVKTGEVLQIRGLLNYGKKGFDLSDEEGETGGLDLSQNNNNDCGGFGKGQLLNLSFGGLTRNPMNHQTSDEGSGDKQNFITSPTIPRRKQARPRRRSGDFVAQDLRKEPEKEKSTHALVIDYTTSSPAPNKAKRHKRHHHNNHMKQNWLRNPSTPPGAHPSPVLKAERDSDNWSSGEGQCHSNASSPNELKSACFPPDFPMFDHSPGNLLLPMSFKTSPPSPGSFFSIPGMGHHGHSDESNNTGGSPPIFSPVPGFSMLSREGNNNNGGGNHWPSMPLGPAPIFGRHRAQHSAPRGGPPRAWSNADLTEALHNVWNKKMTTSQASRIFGIPYNSLLMYVRGKYGKSLKLDLLKKGLDMALENNANAAANSNHTPNNNNNNKCKSSPPPPLNLLDSMRERGGELEIPPGFNPLFGASGLFGEYPPPFPFASALQHILPPGSHLSQNDKHLTLSDDK